MDTKQLGLFAGDTKYSAVISECGKFRYRLERRWGDGKPLVWVMLNPSTADALLDDPTIRRVRGFTEREGYPALVVVNVFALRATNPRELRDIRGGFDGHNMRIIREEVFGRDVIAAWGNHAAGCPTLQYVRMALVFAGSVRCLGLTKSGQPAHPLFLRRDTEMVKFNFRTL